MAATPKLTSIRDALVDLFEAELTGPSSANYWYDTTVEEGIIDLSKLAGIEKPIIAVRRMSDGPSEDSPIGAHRKRRIATFIVDGYINTTGNRTAIERLARDVWQAITTDADLSCNTESINQGTVTYEDDEVMDIGDATATLRSHFEMTLEITYTETYS